MSSSGPARHAVFLDIDGTFAHLGEVPPAHIAAVRSAREAGHAVLLCTGRPRCMVPDRLMEAGFDGFVGGAGAYVEIGGRQLSDTRFPPGLAARAVEVLDRHDVAYLLEGTDALHGPTGVDRRLRERFARRFPDPQVIRWVESDILGPLKTADDLAGVPFAKITCFDSPTPIPDLAAEIGPEVAPLPSSVPGMGRSAGEIYLVGVNKAVGMCAAADQLGIPLDRVVAVGDGANDIEMIEAAGIGVAIEGADPDVLAVADRLAAGPESEGLAALFADLGLV